jgi:sulfonate transport system substrate-binding protein
MADIDRRFFGLGALGFLLGAGALQGCARRSDRLRASVVGKGESDTDLLLNTAGLAPQGFSIETSRFPSGQQVVEALNGGSLDVGGMSEIPPVFAAASATHSFRQIAVLKGDVNNQVVLVPKGSPIRSLKDLKGRKIGYVRATTSQYFLIRMLQSAGLSWSDIHPIALGVSDGQAAFSTGAIEAWAIYGYPIQQAVATQGARVLRTALGFLSGNYVVVAHVDALADPARSQQVGDYLALLKRGWAWSNAHLDEWAKAVQQQVGVPLAYVEDSLRHRSAPYDLVPVTAQAIASQQAVADLFADQKLIPQRVNIAPLWDDRFTSILSSRS